MSKYAIGYNIEHDYHWFRRIGRKGKVIVDNCGDIGRFVRRVRRVDPAATFDLCESAEQFRVGLLG